MKICLIASELHPFAKTGGLADVAAALQRFLRRRGHDVRLFLPYYSSLAAGGPPGPVPVEFLQEIPLWLGREYRFTAYTLPEPGSGPGTYFLRCPDLYGRPFLYTDDPDEHRRFALLSRAAIECCQRMGWGPDVLHCHDWHAALAPLYVKTLYAWDSLFHHTRTLLTIHNLGYQGLFPAAALGDLGLADHTHLLDGNDLAGGRINFLRTGILHADRITTVSPTYAREIRSAEQGMGLHDALGARGDAVVGILNGVDYDIWSPERDRFLPCPYSRDDLRGKHRNRACLLESLELRPEPAGPVLAVISRLAEQKGIDLFFDTLPRTLARSDVRLAALGAGDRRYEAFFEGLEATFPGKARFFRGYNDELAHRIEAGADVFLMPSRYEPCGLNQMYSLRYGTIPVVRKTGGLADTVRAYDSRTDEGTGFVFEAFRPAELRRALGQALETWRDRAAWHRMMRRAMAEDYSWDRQGALYEDLYRRLAA